MSSSASKCVIGNNGEYRFTLEYYPDTTTGSYLVFDEENLPQLKGYLDFNEPIERITLFNCDLKDSTQKDLISHGQFLRQCVGLASKYLFHSIIVIKTKNWFYTVEKFNTHVQIRRYDTFENVKVFNVDPKFIREFPSCGNQQTLGYLVDVIQSEQLVSSPYVLLGANCKHFAACIFEKLTGVTLTVGPRGDILNPC